MKFTPPPNPDPYGLDRLGGESMLASLLWVVLIGAVMWRLRRQILAPTRPLVKHVRDNVHVPVPGYLSKRNAQHFTDIAPAPNAGMSRRPVDQGVRASCLWTEVPALHKKNVIAQWRCGTCGADGFSRDGREPTDCKQGLRGAVLDEAP